MALICTWMAVGACTKPETEIKGLPPANSWQAPPASPSTPQGAGAVNPVNPHGGMTNPHAGMTNPHAGMTNPHAGMTNPHAGMENPHAGMTNPHAGMTNPHAGMENPHAGMTNPHAGMMNPHTGGDPHAGMMNPHAAAGAVDVTQLGLPPPDPERAIDPDRFLKGTIKPTSDTKGKIPPHSVIFVSVKKADPATGEPTGAPLAAKRLQLGTGPLWFHITEADAMVGGTTLEGDVVITAWSDQDQDAISKQPGDVRGQIRAQVPAQDLTLVLDTVIR